jgi:SAM-dependent methyltransferase
MNADKETFLAAIHASLDAGTFVRITLGKFRGAGDAQKIVVTRVTLKGKDQLKFVTSLARKDVTQNFAFADAIKRIDTLAGEDFLSATLFTTQEDLTLLYSKKKTAHLSRGKPAFATQPAADHNRAKQYIIDPARPFLKHLGVTDTSGIVKPSMYPKFKQICHFIEITDALIRESDVRDLDVLDVVDIGSGKGYLTFALYDYLAAKMGGEIRVTGIEVRPDLVDLCNTTAKRVSFNGLTFEAVAADKAQRQADIVIALHACDTATDDAMFQGVSSDARLIITAPCCQHELAPQLSRPDLAVEGLMKFGLFKHRQADLITDAARCLLLEASGYKVKVIEFVSTEHTAKNILIAATRSATVDRSEARRQYDALKAFAGFKSQHLESLLAGLEKSALPGE